jgi:sugar O-acyltransferase (sialic acid O-acetyltransferase NeuD family)
MPPTNVVILGTGGTSLDILDIIHDINRAAGREEYRCVRMLEDNPDAWGREIQGIEVSGPLASAARLPDCLFVNGIGSPATFWMKEAIIGRTAMPIDRFVTLVHPSASVSRTASLGEGTVILQNVTINSNVRVGKHVVVLPNSVISHHGMIGDYACLATGVCLSGGVAVGMSTYLGSRCAIKENVRIGDRCLVGMGSVVLRDVPENSVVAGCPARFLRRTAVENVGAGCDRG